MEVVKEGVFYLVCPKCKGNKEDCNFCSGRKMIPMLEFLKENTCKKYGFSNKLEFMKYLNSFMSGWYKDHPNGSPLDDKYLNFYFNLSKYNQREYLDKIRKNKQIYI